MSFYVVSRQTHGYATPCRIVTGIEQQCNAGMAMDSKTAGYGSTNFLIAWERSRAVRWNVYSKAAVR